MSQTRHEAVQLGVGGFELVEAAHTEELHRAPGLVAQDLDGSIDAGAAACLAGDPDAGSVEIEV